MGKKSGNPIKSPEQLERMAEAAAAHREGRARHSREKSAAVAEIGPLPEVKLPARKEKCRLSLLDFLVSYFPHSTGSGPFSEDHRRFIGRLQSTIIEGGREIAAVYRGFAKTTVAENACLWALLYGHRRFVILLGGDNDASKKNLQSLRSELEGNDLLYEDFPEVCHAVRALEGKAQRCRSQTLYGELTHIGWTSDNMVFPVAPDSIASGACVRTKSLLACNRGMTHKRFDGVQLRPEFVFVDDPQTDQSAKQPAQCRKRIDKLYQTVLRLAGHKVSLSCFVAATVIQKDDMIDELLDKSRHPSWRGERVPMVKSWSTAHDSFWLGEYAAVRRNFDPVSSDDRERAQRQATNLYAMRREEADSGCDVSWFECFNPDNHELSAIQHAYNILIDDGKEVFDAECQNNPSGPADEVGRLTSYDLLVRPKGTPRGIAPLESNIITVGVDVQERLLYWLAVAWQADTFTGQVIDFGTFPQQARSYFTYAEATRTLQTNYHTADTEGAIYNGVLDLLNWFATKRWERSDKNTQAPNLILVDTGFSTGVVYAALRKAALQNAMAARGKGIRAKDRPITEWTIKQGNRRGREWLISRPEGRDSQVCQFDSNYWQSTINASWRLAAGSRGAIMLPEMPRGEIEMVCDQFTAEKATVTTALGRTIEEWECVGGRDNHFGDCLKMASVAASVTGCLRVGQERATKPVQVRKAVKYL